MKVYRYLCEDELKNWLQNDTSMLGSRYDKIKVSNNHKYKESKLYLHFFAKIDDLDYIRSIKSHEKKDFYICLFDIPAVKLLPHMGKGYYDSRSYNYYMETVREFALPVSEIKPSYLLYYIKDQKRDISPQDVKASVGTAKLKHDKREYKCSAVELKIAGVEDRVGVLSAGVAKPSQIDTDKPILQENDEVKAM